MGQKTEEIGTVAVITKKFPSDSQSSVLTAMITKAINNILAQHMALTNANIKS